MMRCLLKSGFRIQVYVLFIYFTLNTKGAKDETVEMIVQSLSRAYTEINLGGGARFARSAKFFFAPP